MKIDVPANFLGPFEKNDFWVGSRFEHIKNLSPKRKGSHCEKIAKFGLSEKGYIVESADSTEYDFIINKKFRIELKSSFVMTNGKFTILQIRPNQNYDMIAVFAFQYDDASLFFFHKNKIASLINEGSIVPQHGGKFANSGTFMWYPDLQDLRVHSEDI